MRNPLMSRLVPAMLAVAAFVLSGCASGGGGRCGGNACGPCGQAEGPCGPKGPPLDLPQDPDPCVKYCKVWVEPVYRDVPKLVPVCGGTKNVLKDVTTTRFVTKATPGKCYGCTTPSCDCDETAVEVCPGGYRWQQQDGCWKYCYCPPKYKWCKKQIHEDGISFCMEEPTTYETVAVRNTERVCDTQYTPPTYKTVWCKELYKPGHWEWVKHQDCSPAPSCDCCKPHTYVLPGGCDCSK